MKTSAHNIRILSLLLLFTLLHSISEAKQYFFQQIPSQNGLSSMVRCMEVSQEKGYVWIGTRSGIGRFDGYEQRRYLRGNVTHILEDEEHTIWAITEKGVFRYNEKEDKFTLVRDKDNNPVIASSLCLWEDGVIFGGRGSLYKYNYEDHIINLFHTLKPNGKYHIPIFTNGIPALSWPPTDGQKLCLLISLRATPVLFPSTVNRLSHC